MAVIAIDGPAASGKGTLAEQIAEHFGFHYLNTGLLYRATAARALSLGTALDDADALVSLAKALTEADLQDGTLAKEAVGQAASSIAALLPLRQALTDYQRTFAARGPGAVLDGRDIGTVICPQAEVKLYVTARADVRAMRRLLQNSEAVTSEAMEAMTRAIEARDQRDQSRANMPLQMAEDALLLDTSELTIEGALQAALDLIGGRVSCLKHSSDK